MTLEDYLEFIGDHAIRIAGTRVGIETVLADYQEGASPEEIIMRYPTLSLLQVHATITYYLSHRQEVDAYLKRVYRLQEDAGLEQQQHPSAFVRALRQRLEKQQQSFYNKTNERDRCAIFSEIPARPPGNSRSPLYVATPERVPSAPPRSMDR